MIRAIPGRGRPARTCYVAVFVCLVTKAMHLEVVLDYSTDYFIAAFKRFISHYSLPSVMMSDNGTKFLMFEEMTTLLAEISASLNSRPISPKTDSIDDFSFHVPGGITFNK